EPAQVHCDGSDNACLTATVQTAFGFITTSGDPGAPNPVDQITAVSVPMAATSIPPAALQPNSPYLLDTGDDRFMSAVVQNYKLWTTAGVACTPLGDTTVRSCIRLVEVQLSPLVMLQDFTTGSSGEYLS